jgi:hypothetical protein
MASGRMMRMQLETRGWAPLLTEPQQRRRAEEITAYAGYRVTGCRVRV